MNNLVRIWDSFHPQLFALLMNTAWQLALLATLILLSIFLLKIRTAVIRYGLWLMVVFSPLFLPLLNLSVPTVNIHLFRHQSEQSVYEERTLSQKYPMAISESAYHLPRKNTEFSDSKTDTIRKSSPINKEQPSVTTTMSRPASNTKSESRFVSSIPFDEILLLLWMVGFFGVTARFAKGLHGLRSLRKDAVYVEDDSIINLLYELRNSLGIQRKIQLATSTRLTYPVSFGWRKPIILMPTNFTDTMSLAEVRLTFIHEIAHFKRRDYLINIVSSFLRIPLFFHPLFILAQKQLQIQQEHICDDWVIQLSQNRTTYARCLLRQAEVAILKTAPSIGTSVVSGFKNMRRRIDMILDKKRALSINLSKKAAVLVLLICGVFTALAATTRLLPFALAQQTEEEKLIAQIKQAWRWYPMDDKLSKEQRTAAYRKNSEKALALCQQFLEKYPQHENVEVLFSQVSFLSGILRRYDEAEQLAHEFLAKHPTGPYADRFRWRLVSNYQKEGKYNAALAELELIKAPEWEAHWERYQIYLQTGRPHVDIETEYLLCLQSIIGKPAPSFSAKTINGEKISLEKLRGKVVLLAFHQGYFPWTAERWKRLYDKYKDRQDFVMVSIVSNAIPETLRDYNLDWRHILDEEEQDKSITWRYKHHSSRNVTYLIDKHGLIRDLSPVQPPDLIRFKAILETALAEDAKDAQATEFASIHYAKARKLHVEDKLNEAIREYETAVRLCSSAPYHWYSSLAYLYREKGMYERAIAMRLKEIELTLEGQNVQPKGTNNYGLGSSYIRLAELYVEVGKNKEAVKALKKAIDLHPTAANVALENPALQILLEDEELQKFATSREPGRKLEAERRQKEQSQWLTNIRKINSAIVELVIEPTETFKYGIAAGVIINEDGDIIACSEVADQKEIEVRIERERQVDTYKAQVIGRDDELGVALLKVDADVLHLPPFIDSDKVEPRKVSQSSVMPIEALGIGIVRTPDGKIRKSPTARYLIRKTLRNESGQAVKYLFGMIGRIPGNIYIPCQVLATKQGEVFAIGIADSERETPQFVPINLVKAKFE